MTNIPSGGDADSGGGYACVAHDVHGNSPYHSLNFAGKIKLLLRNSLKNI